MAVPGNAGIGRKWSCHPIRYGDRDTFFEIVEQNAVDLVVVGPEGPLVEGMADALVKRGIAVFGPTAKAARLEGSKVFMKTFAQEVGIPTAPFKVFKSPTAARAYVRTLDVPPVIKADGLCAGKGVVVAESVSEALSAVDAILERRAFGESGAAIVVEERLHGQEVSVQAMCDGERMFVLPVAQDHKRLKDGDLGANTGGMGAYAPVPLVTPELEKRIRDRILEPTLTGMRDRGMPFRGVLFAGLMITPEGDPFLLEFNARFGDPEAQVTLPLLQGDFGQVCYACARGELEEGMLTIENRHSLGVVLASHGYPKNVRTGDSIRGLDEVESLEDVKLFHAGTRALGDRLVTSSGRVVTIVGMADSLQNARDRAYQACDMISFDGMQLRRDIGGRALS
ncbi:MAG: Phosphoribosylamine--glycine ligase [Deltaproteobacteria bacterium ADurb.Bin207]|jgi:phosphoribosylamine--glycine ligase|nr:MAG: Phosphoribosylamine--glycine ligase [Deltaproteobacteria bacterium ADurb.Bin207]